MPQAVPTLVNVHDFVDKKLGKVAPYGIYDVATNTGWVSLGIDHDTAEFAVNAVRRWHQVVGSVRYPEANRMLITADGGGSNGSRVRLWKLELQTLADETGLSFPGVSLSAGNLEVEQDRAPHVLPHHPDLARQAARRVASPWST